MIMTPAETVPGVVEECARAGVRGAVDHLGGLPRIRAPRRRNWNARFLPRPGPPGCASSGPTVWA